MSKHKNVKRRKTNSEQGKHKPKYAKPVSLYPLKPEDALAAFMKVNPKNIKPE
jgi:hypothetical protein